MTAAKGLTHLATGDAAWAALEVALEADARPPAGTPGAPWNARDVYAHLARWQADSIRNVKALLAGEPLHEPEADEQTLNARWAAEDSSLSCAEARERCLAAREELRGLMERLTEDEWSRWGWKIEDIVGPHYEEHRAALTAR